MNWAICAAAAYSACEYAGIEAAVDNPYTEARPFYLTLGIVTLVGALTVLIPNIPLVTILVGHPGAERGAAGAAAVRDDRHRAGPRHHGTLHIGRPSTIAYFITTAVVVLCVATLAVTSLTR